MYCTVFCFISIYYQSFHRVFSLLYQLASCSSLLFLSMILSIYFIWYFITHILSFSFLLPLLVFLMIPGINRDGTGNNHGGAAPNLTPPRLARTCTRTLIHIYLFSCYILFFSSFFCLSYHHTNTSFIHIILIYHH